jgi:hypothetical protein
MKRSLEKQVDQTGVICHHQKRLQYILPWFEVGKCDDKRYKGTRNNAGARVPFDPVKFWLLQICVDVFCYYGDSSCDPSREEQ